MNLNELKTGKYKHYKEKFYEVIGIARHNETLEELVVYRVLYDSTEFRSLTLWVRPNDLFSETMLVDDNEIYQFEYIE